MICARRPQRDSAGTADHEALVGAPPVVTMRKDYAMPGVKLCGEPKPDHGDQTCCRRNGHKGKHRDRRASTWPNTLPRPQYKRYVPPHRRTEGEAYDTTRRRYQRPGEEASPDMTHDSPAALAPDNGTSVDTQTLAG